MDMCNTDVNTAMMHVGMSHEKMPPNVESGGKPTGPEFLGTTPLPGVVRPFEVKELGAQTDMTPKWGLGNDTGLGLFGTTPFPTEANESGMLHKEMAPKGGNGNGNATGTELLATIPFPTGTHNGVLEMVLTNETTSKGERGADFGATGGALTTSGSGLMEFMEMGNDTLSVNKTGKGDIQTEPLGETGNDTSMGINTLGDAFVPKGTHSPPEDINRTTLLPTGNGTGKGDIQTEPLETGNDTSMGNNTLSDISGQKGTNAPSEGRTPLSPSGNGSTFSSGNGGNDTMPVKSDFNATTVPSSGGSGTNDTSVKHKDNVTTGKPKAGGSGGGASTLVTSTLMVLTVSIVITRL